MTLIAPIGWCPTAVSCESITASVPSRIALATSATSARVGREEVTIESSICVAVIDGRASAPAIASSLFCTIGTCSIGISMPRSPRATMTQSDTLRIASARSTACGFSTLTISGVRVCSRTNVTSSGRRTKLSATRSTPICWPTRRCPRSSSGTAGRSVASPGMFNPWREATVPPTSTSVSISPSPARTAVTRRRIEPSSRYMISPGWTADASPGQVIDMRRASPGSPPSPLQTKVRWSPMPRSAVPSRSAPMRSLGPGRSCRIATGRPARPAASRTRWAISACCSAVPWLKLRRATSMPASTMRTRTSRSLDAGPIVATILVRRSMSARTVDHGRGRARGAGGGSTGGTSAVEPPAAGGNSLLGRGDAVVGARRVDAVVVGRVVGVDALVVGARRVDAVVVGRVVGVDAVVVVDVVRVVVTAQDVLAVQHDVVVVDPRGVVARAAVHDVAAALATAVTRVDAVVAGLAVDVVGAAVVADAVVAGAAVHAVVAGLAVDVVGAVAAVHAVVAGAAAHHLGAGAGGGFEAAGAVAAVDAVAAVAAALLVAAGAAVPAVVARAAVGAVVAGLQLDVVAAAGAADVVVAGAAAAGGHG